MILERTFELENLFPHNIYLHWGIKRPVSGRFPFERLTAKLHKFYSIILYIDLIFFMHARKYIHLFVNTFMCAIRESQNGFHGLSKVLALK